MCKLNAQFIIAGENCKVVLIFAMKAYGQSIGTAPHILDLDTGQHHAPAALPPGKNPNTP